MSIGLSKTSWDDAGSAPSRRIVFPLRSGTSTHPFSTGKPGVCLQDSLTIELVSSGEFHPLAPSVRGYFIGVLPPPSSGRPRTDGVEQLLVHVLLPLPTRLLRFIGWGW